MKLRKPRTYRKGRIEIIPMIDVMFFLLVTFMLSSLSMQNLDSLQVNLPQGEAEKLKADAPVTLTLTGDSMNVTSKKNITSIIGMISMRPLRYVLGLRSFMGATLLIQTDMIDQTCTKTLHFIHRL